MADNNFEVLVIGGSYAGLSAAMSLGRSLRRVLLIDSGQPCNKQTPHSHNFLTQDGQKPATIAATALAQVKQYASVTFYEGKAINCVRTEKGFELITEKGDLFRGQKIIFATGIKDLMPDITGFAECWGISVIHCPYCHGYEVRNQQTGILANGDMAFHYAQLIHNWTPQLVIFTNGPSTLSPEQQTKLKQRRIEIIETPIAHFDQTNGQLNAVVFQDESTFHLKAIYARPAFVQSTNIPLALGCELTEQGLIKVDAFQKTTVAGVFACGDATNPMRSVALAVATGSATGAFVNHELIGETF